MKEQKWLDEGWFYHNHAWHLLHEIIKLIPKKTEYLLDIGAGSGIAAALIKAAKPEIEPYLTDISEESIEFWEQRGIRGEIVKKSALPFRDNSFDFVMSSHVLEHAENHVKFIYEAYRVCKKRLVLVVPDGDVHFYDHKVIYNRTLLEKNVDQALEGLFYKKTSFPIYHSHINNLIMVIDKC